jgi:hypothetical protein
MNTFAGFFGNTRFNAAGLLLLLLLILAGGGGGDGGGVEVEECGNDIIDDRTSEVSGGLQKPVVDENSDRMLAEELSMKFPLSTKVES